jgi:hypothetical protein
MEVSLGGIRGTEGSGGRGWNTCCHIIYNFMTKRQKERNLIRTLIKQGPIAKKD